MKNLNFLALIGLSLSVAGCPDDAATGDPQEQLDMPSADAGSADAELDGTVLDAALNDAAAVEDDAGSADAAIDGGNPDAGPDAMPPAPPERCSPPCSVRAACDGHLVCEAGECVPLERMQCEGGCVEGACVEVNCNLPEDQCVGPLKWLADLVRYNGEMASLRSMMVAAVNNTSDRVQCASETFMTMRCIEPENPVRRVCEAQNVSRAMVEGELSFRDESIELCNEFSGLRSFELTAAGYRNTPFGDQEPRLQIDGVASRSDETYYTPSHVWRLALSVNSAVERFDRPLWAPAGATRIEASGRYSRGTEEGADFPSAGYRETRGNAQAVRPDGSRWSAEWDVTWQVPFDAMMGEPPQPGCMFEPWQGEAQVQETLPDGSEGSTWMLIFDGGRSVQFCTGNVSVIKDGMVAPPLQSLGF